MTYTISNNCTAVTIVTINPLPAAITNNSPVCTGLSFTLSDASAPGTWSSTNTAVATVGSGTGTVTGVAGGTATVSYTLSTGCKISTVVTVNAIQPIIGNNPACLGTTLILTDASAGGTWSSSNTGVASVGTTGLVTGIGTGGTATISYTLPSGCISMAVVTINQTPSAITGTPSVCFGSTTALTDAIPGGTWSSNAGFVATIGSTGIVTPFSAGTATISYISGAGCYTTTLFTVYPLPSVIGGSAAVCFGSTITLSDFATGGTWSSSNSNVSVDGSGHVTGLVVGSSTITYTLPTGCLITAPEQVNPLPGGITGSLLVCAGSTTFVADPTTPGLSWTSSNTAIATIINSGVATGVSAGTTTLTYTIPTGCWTTAVLTVNPLPAAIGGNTPVCLGGTLTLSDITPSGTWSSLDNTTATIGSASGVVSTVGAGPVIMNYTIGTGCSISAIVTVNPVYALTGNSPICMGQNITLTDAAPGGTWVSNNPTVATISPVFGIVTPATPGTATISYLLSTGCSTTSIVTVTSAISAVSGASATCAAPSTLALSDATVGGAWSSGDITIATVDGTAGIVSGVTAGVVNITYSIGAGCVATTTVTINYAPPVLTGTSTVCAGLTTSLSNAYPDGTWSTSNAATADVSSYTGVVTGITGGTANITYTIYNGCYNYLTVTVNPLVSVINGAALVCVGATDNLMDTTSGGTWSTSDATVATVGSTGLVTGIDGGSATITYTAPTGCITAFNIVVNPFAGVISGVSNVDIGAVTSLTDIIGGGAWTISNGNATIDSVGDVTGVTAGTSVVSYTIVNICGTDLATLTVTVNSDVAPVIVSGGGAFCDSAIITADNGGDGTIYFEGTTSGGTSTAIVSTSQTITASGTYYFRAQSTLGVWGVQGSVTVTINPNPAAITGTQTVCAGSTINLTDAGGGTWSSSDITIANIGSATGIANGIATGTAMITYTLPTGCLAITTVTVNSLPAAISGSAIMCTGSTASLNDATAGGTWSSNNGSIATIGTAGVVTGVSAGITTVTYTLPTGCYVTTPVTVNTLPSAITGTKNICVGLTTTLTDSVAGGTWTSSDTTTASINSSGVVTAVAVGTATITYTLGSGCIITTSVTVTGLPSGITGTTSACVGSTASLSDATSGGTWTSGNTSTVSIGSATGLATGVAGGVTTITYTASTGCIATTQFTVNALPATVIAGGMGTYCGSTIVTAANGGSGTIYFQGTTSGGTSTATPSTSQLVTTSGTYYFRALSATGCWGTEGSVAVTINPIPAIITGTTSVCIGLTTNLTDATAGGTWSSSNSGIASISSTGTVTGVANGTANITYALASGCQITTPITVNPLPASISGTTLVCAGSTTSLSDATLGGTWSSNNSSIAAIGSATGLATTGSGGVAVITYTLPTGCIATTGLTVNALPTTVSVAGGGAFCNSTTITASNGGSGTIYFQGTTSGGTSTATASSSQLITSSGTYYFRAMSAAGCWGPEGSTTVTINPLPAAISGTTSLCAGASYTLTDASSGGTWTSSNLTVATIGSTTGLVNGLTVGTSTMSYTLPTGCSTTITITVAPLPASVTGASSVCLGATTTFSDVTVGGTWSSDNAYVATVGSTGVVTGVVSGSANIVYTTGAGCSTSSPITVNPLPSAISGATGLCLGSVYSLTDGVAGGLWSSNTPAVATIDGGGSLTLVGTGTSSISYSLPTGCYTSVVITVNPLPAAISGTTTVCSGVVSVLSDANAGGTWSSSNGSVASVSSGSVTGVSSGTAIITYTLATGCYTTASFTVNQSPAAITGISVVCQGLTTSLTNSVAGGTWSSSNGAIATIGTPGVVTGVSGGTSIISYTIGSCFTTMTITVNAIAAISGNSPVCVGATIVLSDAVAGGTWTSSSISIASIGTDGLVTGINAGTSTISYVTSAGCSAATVVTINAIPQIIFGSPTVCAGLTTTLSDYTTGGTWSSNDITIATAGSASGIINGVAAGTTTITYTSSAGCYSTKTVTVYPFSGIIGSAPICVGSTLALTDATAGGTWSISDASVATVGSTGIITGVGAATATLSYSLASGCIATTVITVNTMPSAIAGNLITCVGMTTSLSDATSGGSWTSGAIGVAAVGTNGIVTGTSAGQSTITYALSSGCQSTTIVTINAVPTTINGMLALCAGSTTTLTNAIAGGTWSSSNPANATIGITSGVLTGVVGGTATITYTMSAGCFATTIITVNSISPITGVLSACVGSTTALADATPGGTWSSSNASIASVVGTTGVVSGVSLGTATISYTIPSGCVRTATVAVNSLPGSISGTTGMCIGASITLSDAVKGGSWGSGNLVTISVNSGSGVVTGLAAGTAVVTYTAGSGCFSTITVTVYPSPSGIGGASAVCVGNSVMLSDFVSGGTWTSDNGNVTFGSTTGVVTGITAGSSIISYTLSTGCYQTYNITINASAPPVTGASTVCIGSTGFVSDASSGGISWTSSNTSVATITYSGAVTGISAGTTIVTYTASTGCIATAVITVNSVAPAITGNTPLCAGSTISLTDAQSGGTWVSSNGSIAAVGSATGVITGIAGGTATVNYLLNGGCNINVIVTVNPILPITGVTTACVGSTTTLADGTVGGTWSSSNTGVATIGSSNGFVTGITSGIATITYSVPSGCTRTTTINITPMTVITGSPVVCAGYATALTDVTTGGTWSSNAGFIATVGTNGIVTGVAAGTANITYAISGCAEVQVVTVNALPSGIGGASSVCTGSSITLSDFVSGGTWTSSNSNATVGSATGIVSGITTGTSTITYTISSTGCYRTYSMITNPTPSAITGANTVCVGSVAFVSDPSSGGISWSSSNTAAATITNSGAMTGVAAGTTTITYTVSTGCITTEVITVNAIPTAGTITGTMTAIIGSHVTLSDAVSGGVWTSSNAVVATLGSATGTVTAINSGTTMITYTVTNGSSCSAFTTAVFSVTASAPHSAGSGEAAVTICVGATTSINEPITGGAWSCSNYNVATVDAEGTIRGMSAGNATISYTLVSGFGTNIITTPLAVDALPGNVIITANPATNIGEGEMVTLQATVDNAGVTPLYQWLVNGVAVTGANSSQFVSNSLADNDSVTCEIVSSGTCSGYMVANTIGLKINALGLANDTHSDVSIRPNPSNGTFTVKGNLASIGDEQATLEITDELGQLIYSEKVITHAGFINEKVSLEGSLANGIYILNLRTASENKTFHFVIEK
jgi:uncharacterized protein YjdB